MKKLNQEKINTQKDQVGQPSQDIVLEWNEDLLEFMYKTYADNLYAYGLSIHPNISIVEDAIHDVLIDVYMNKKRFGNISNLKQYLKTAFRHRLLFLLQDNKRCVKILDEEPEFLAEKNTQEVWIEKEEEKDKEKLIDSLLSKLTHRQREAIHLRFIDQLSYDEISEMMQINYQSVKTLIQRAISKIRIK